MSGLIYWIKDGTGLSKLGITTNLKQRFRQIKGSNPFAEIVGTIETPDYESIEDALKVTLESRNVGGEWFCLLDSDDWFLNQHWDKDMLTVESALMLRYSWLIKEAVNFIHTNEWDLRSFPEFTAKPVSESMQSAFDKVYVAVWCDIAKFLEYVAIAQDVKLEYERAVDIALAASRSKSNIDYKQILAFALELSNKTPNTKTKKRRVRK